MADDLFIKPAGGGSQQSNNGDDANISPVIDLRTLDQTASQGGSSQTQGQAGSSTTGTSQGQTQPQPPQPQPPQPPKKNTISLEDDANQYVVAGSQKYAIPTLVREKFPDLIQLIKETESMSDDEREYWFQILPIMTEAQIQKFRTILVNEKEQLARLDKEYEDELKKLNEKHMAEWKAFERKKEREALQTAEAQANASEKSLEEQLLQQLNQV